MSLSNQDIILHEKVMSLVHSDKQLSYDEKLFILENFQESYNKDNKAAGAFFTPLDLCRDFTIDIGNTNSGVDLCAGIGKLSWYQVQNLKNQGVEIDWTCVEYNYDYYSVGKRVLPECEWIYGDVFEYCQNYTGTKKHVAISNPPFGNIRRATDLPESHLYRLKNFEFQVIEAAKAVATYGVFLLPQNSSPFRLSGVQYFQKQSEFSKAGVFTKKTGIVLDAGCGVDTSFYKDDWHGVKIVTEVVLADY